MRNLAQQAPCARGAFGALLVEASAARSACSEHWACSQFTASGLRGLPRALNEVWLRGAFGAFCACGVFCAVGADFFTSRGNDSTQHRLRLQTSLTQQWPQRGRTSPMLGTCLATYNQHATVPPKSIHKTYVSKLLGTCKKSAPLATQGLEHTTPNAHGKGVVSHSRGNVQRGATRQIISSHMRTAQHTHTHKTCLGHQDVSWQLRLQLQAADATAPTATPTRHALARCGS